MAIEVLHNETFLLNRISQKDEASFNRIYSFYSDRVYAFAFRILQNEMLAEEIVQDVFTKLWEYEDIEDIKSVYAWLRILTRNQAYKLLRRQAIEIKATALMSHDWKEEQNYTEQQMDYKDVKHMLDLAIAQLPLQQRRVYFLVHVDGLTYEQAAQQLGLSKLTVHSHVKAALKNIRHTLHNNNKFVALLFFYGLIR